MIDSIEPGRRSGGTGPLVSALAHGIGLVALLGVMHRHAQLEPYRLPGTKSGVQFLTYYSPGSTHPAVTTVQAKVVDKPVTTPTLSVSAAWKSCPKSRFSSGVKFKLGPAMGIKVSAPEPHVFSTKRDTYSEIWCRPL